MLRLLDLSVSGLTIYLYCHCQYTLLIPLLTCQHTDNREQNFFNTLDRTPSLSTCLISHGVISRGVKDGNAHAAIRVNWKMKSNCRMTDAVSFSNLMTYPQVFFFSIQISLVMLSKSKCESDSPKQSPLSSTSIGSSPTASLSVPPHPSTPNFFLSPSASP